MKVKVEVSARHLHINAEDFKKIWGKDELTKMRDVSQTGQYTCEETVTLKGPKSELKNVRILGPFRSYTKAECSKTDSINLGIDAPYASSGKESGATIEIVGPKGSITKNAINIPKRHFHMTEGSARELGIASGDIVSVKIEGERGLVFNNVEAVISPADAVQIDTDEGNAAGIIGECMGEIIL